MSKQIKIDTQEQIEIAAETLARILIQQVLIKQNRNTAEQIEKKYGKSS
jgi:exoribonuclease R